MSRHLNKNKCMNPDCDSETFPICSNCASRVRLIRAELGLHDREPLLSWEVYRPFMDLTRRFIPRAELEAIIETPLPEKVSRDRALALVSAFVTPRQQGGELKVQTATPKQRGEPVSRTSLEDRLNQIRTEIGLPNVKIAHSITWLLWHHREQFSIGEVAQGLGLTRSAAYRRLRTHGMPHANGKRKLEYPRRVSRELVVELARRSTVEANWLTTATAAERLGQCKATIRRKWEEKILKGELYGSDLYISPESVDRHLEDLGLGGEHYTTERASEITGIAVDKIRQYCADHDVPQRNRHYVLTADDVEELRNPTWIGTPEFAEVLRVSTETVRNWCKMKKVEFRRTKGGIYEIRRAEIERVREFLANWISVPKAADKLIVSPSNLHQLKRDHPELQITKWGGVVYLHRTLMQRLEWERDNLRSASQIEAEIPELTVSQIRRLGHEEVLEIKRPLLGRKYYPKESATIIRSLMAEGRLVQTDKGLKIYLKAAA